jgi:hypothetical protein
MTNGGGKEQFCCHLEELENVALVRIPDTPDLEAVDELKHVKAGTSTMTVQDRIRKYRTQGAGFVRVEVLVPPSGRE